MLNSEIDVSKCRFYIKDGSCSSMNEECTKCVHNYCDWKVNQEQLQQLKATLDEIGEIVSKGVKIHDDIIVNKQILQLIK